MLHSDIIKIAVKNGWQVSITDSEDGFFFDFHRRTLGGLQFSFTAELTDGLVGTLVDEITSFVDCARPRALMPVAVALKYPVTYPRHGIFKL